ncbi:putative E3 ubiquitin-protein ligase [Trypanosoma rangeli]|uniref:RING-type E3 ubiquitin transferase n=1 Tax=Trypanosoma rangeli TaxID=5698 RepID=A0A3R7KN02_TRYRA|nr:putative E3 ubiquitin-protein ligase [Trypanosoma rangeli]RNE97815.1 putative E3 ubiquitin-protein ligase [Trypanosoma rangeli]|eukprot:RNE97815.1 putative E3 ubiquitin-protein ligase [Trypanosoma rangeli]
MVLQKAGCASESSVFSSRVSKRELAFDEVSTTHDSVQGSCTSDCTRIVKPVQAQLHAFGTRRCSTSSSQNNTRTSRLHDTKTEFSAEGGDSTVSRSNSYSVRTGSMASSMKAYKEKETVVDAEYSEEEEICCICLEGYTEENPVMYGRCGHHLHLPCLMNWKQRSNICPICSSESLGGVADDIEASPPVHMTDEDIFSLLLQQHLEQYTHPARQHNQREYVHARGHELTAHSTVRHATRSGNALQRHQNRATLPDESRRPTRGRRESGALANASSRKLTRVESGTRVRNMKENTVVAFFNRVFCCFKR